ncbi:MAG: 16S rRNA (cytidine(1402)-2'-O)-methyltransferase [Rhizobacter sp.]|nr:16S rRNA (cytidine(1402)-2'-O)-methyltransferase [Burkholderiaceae bacterium]MCO5123575.1 16S rRNA (cytidine(1402)-2'-O)-methyltransferase [Rhizobacter sp.]
MTIDASLLLRAAADAAGAQQYPAAALYVVATPIGNLADLSLRAIHVLSIVDAVACEDTRHSAPLLRHLGLDKPLVAIHQHNEREAAPAVLARLAGGERVAYVSDAGTPGLSDPGAALVAAVREAGHRVLPIPGPSAALAALSVAGDATASSFRFAGFLPTTAGERGRALAALLAQADAQILFEAPHRIESLCRALGEAAPARRVTLCRELTKQFETVVTLDASALTGWLAEDANRVRGEFVLVVHAPEAKAAAGADAHDATLRVLLEALPLKQAVALAVRLTAAPRNALYERALALKAAGDNATSP